MTDLSHFDVLRRPLITEKSTDVSEHNTYVFEVLKSSNKKNIIEAIESIFEVDVVSVNVSVLKGKQKRFKGRLGQRKDIKKAFIRIKEGQTIDLSEEI